MHNKKDPYTAFNTFGMILWSILFSIYIYAGNMLLIPLFVFTVGCLCTNKVTDFWYYLIASVATAHFFVLYLLHVAVISCVWVFIFPALTLIWGWQSYLSWREEYGR